MKLDDRVLGAGLIGFGALVFWRAQSFPLMGGLPYGPGLFPSIAAVGMMACGAVIALQHAREPDASVAETTGWRDAGRALAILAIVAGVALGLDLLGFHITGALAVAAAALVFGRGLLSAAALGLIATFATHWVFYSVMRVPLPWGLLEPVAW